MLPHWGTRCDLPAINSTLGDNSCLVILAAILKKPCQRQTLLWGSQLYNHAFFYCFALVSLPFLIQCLLLLWRFLLSSWFSVFLSHSAISLCFWLCRKLQMKAKRANTLQKMTRSLLFYHNYLFPIDCFLCFRFKIWTHLKPKCACNF